MKDFAGACMFKDQMDLVGIDDRLKICGYGNGEEAAQFIRECDLKARVPCIRHSGSCQIPTADINIFGAPCTDDSQAGNRGQDDGPSRRVSHQPSCVCVICFCSPSLSLSFSLLC